MNAYDTRSQDHGEFQTFQNKTADFRQRMTLKVLSTVGVQLIATVFIVMMNFHLMTMVSQGVVKTIMMMSAIGCFACLISTCWK